MRDSLSSLPTGNEPLRHKLILASANWTRTRKTGS
jgi:hypothetical protein